MTAGFRRSRLRRRLMGYPVTGRVEGLRLTVPLGFARRYLWHDYESVTLSAIRAHVREGMVAVDVGAHIGFVTCVLARLVGGTGRVVALEPDESNATMVRRNLAANGLRADVLTSAAGTYDGESKLHVADSSDMHSLYDHPGSPTREIRTVALRRLDTVTDHADFVKIDTEGGEIDVLEGMSQIFAAGQRPTLIVEWAPRLQVASGHRVDDILGVLRGLGYDLTVLDDRHNRTRDVDEVAAYYRGLDMSTGGHATNLLCVAPAQ